MTRPSSRLLIVEDVRTLAETYAECLRGEDCAVDMVHRGRVALQSLTANPPDVLLLDMHLPDLHGLEVLKAVRIRGLATAVVVITDQASVDLAVEAMKLGAVDFLTKPVRVERLRDTVRNVLERRRQEGDAFREQAEHDSFHGLIGRSVVMQSVYRVLRNSAASAAPVFITGETGTGKRLVAATLHKIGPRSARPYVAVNCALPQPELVDRDIFGQWARVATEDREGAIIKANGGTVLFEEICALPPRQQDKLLHFLETGTVHRRGEDRPRRSDVRMVCSTDRDPRAEVAGGRLNASLLYRLDVIAVELPPLRTRGDDVLLIARDLLRRFAAEERKRFAGLSSEVEALLLAYDWPGNVRELANIMRSIVVLNDGDRVEPDMLPPRLLTPAGRTGPRTAG